MSKVKVGFIVDRYHLEQKSVEFVKYLKSIADVTIYLEETYFLNSNNLTFDEDIFFVKGKGDLILNLVKHIEREEPDIPVINPFKAIWLAINRFMNSVLLKEAGLPVPRFTLNPASISPTFDDYIIKNIIDQKNYRFTPKIEEREGHLHVSDERALSEVAGGKENYHYLYYQEYIESEWEYKIYGIGDDILFYKQVPVLINPNKAKTRRKIEPIPELEEWSRRAMETIGLKLTSIDFLQSKEGDYYLTDINSSPNFNYIKNGPKLIGDFLIEQAKK